MKRLGTHPTRLDATRLDSTVIKLPPIAGGEEPSACLLSDAADKDLASQLMGAWKNGFGRKPVLWLGEQKVGDG